MTVLDCTVTVTLPRPRRRCAACGMMQRIVGWEKRSVPTIEIERVLVGTARRARLCPPYETDRRLRLEEKNASAIKLIWVVQSPLVKIFCFSPGPNHPHISRRLIPMRGVSRSSRTLGWDAVDAAASGAQRHGRAGWRKACEPSTARRRTKLTRTAKPCGPGTRCWC